MKLSRGERIFEVFNTFFLVILSSIFLIPFLSVLSTSFISNAEYVRRGAFILVPEKIDFGAYKLLLNSSSTVFTAFLVSLSRVVVGTFLNLALTFPLAYVLSRPKLTGRSFLTMFVFFTMIFSGGLVPNFLVVENLGLVNSFWSMILPGLINPWWMLIMRNFIMGIPEELHEAAVMDGASPWTIMTRIMIPLSMPAIATIGLFYAVWHWNSWFDAAIYLSDRAKYPLQLVLRAILEAGLGYESTGTGIITASELTEPPPGEVLKAAMIIVSTVPILIVYPFVQKYFVKGVMVGSVKG
ncbi:MAG TPA: carbohydrate ABC transporter permease [Anaerolineaceae bacterium]